MSTNQPTFRYPFALAGQPKEVQQAHIFAFNGIQDVQQAVGALKAQITALQKASSSSSSGSSGSSTATTSGVTSFNSKVGAITYFADLGTKDDQSGQTAYALQDSDNGALLVLNDASPVAVSLNVAITTPFFCFVMNLGVGTVTLTPTSPALINYYGNIGAISMPVLPGIMILLQFDGVNWNAGSIQVPATVGAVAHKFLTSYNAVTGQFTAAQPQFADISGVAATTQIPILDGVSTAIGGAPMTPGQTISVAVSIPGAATGMVAVCSPETYPGDGFTWDAYVSAADVATVRLTAILAGTPTASVYDVRVIE